MATTSFSSRRVLVLLVATALAFMTLDARDSGPFSGIRSFTLTVTTPLRSAVQWVASPLGTGWNGVVHYDDVLQENDELRVRIAELEGELAQVPDNEEALRQLQEATKVDFANQYERVTGRVVSDRQTGLERILEIGIGSEEGIEVGMPVVTASGLVGRVVSVGPATSHVRVITDGRVQVGVISTQSRIVGVTAGRGDGNNLLLDLLDNAKDQLPEDTRFETSGFEASPYPAGVPVGVLRQGSNDQIELEPYADIDRLSFLTVLIYSPEIRVEEQSEGEEPAASEEGPSDGAETNGAETDGAESDSADAEGGG